MVPVHKIMPFHALKAWMPWFHHMVLSQEFRINRDHFNIKQLSKTLRMNRMLQEFGNNWAL